MSISDYFPNYVVSTTNPIKPGVYRCGEKECRKDYTVTTKSVMERSHAPLTSWALASHLYASSKKGFTATQLQRHLGCQYNTACFLHHRVMEAMRRSGPGLPPMGGPGGIVEVDEAYHGPTKDRRQSPQRGNRPYTKGGKSGPDGKRAIVSACRTRRFGSFISCPDRALRMSWHIGCVIPIHEPILESVNLGGRHVCTS